MHFIKGPNVSTNLVMLICSAFNSNADVSAVAQAQATAVLGQRQGQARAAAEEQDDVDAFGEEQSVAAFAADRK